MKYFSLLALITVSSLISMEKEKEYEVMECSRWDSFWLSTKFWFNGQDKYERAFLLKNLVGNYKESNLPLIRSLICANKKVSTREEKFIRQDRCIECISSPHGRLNAALNDPYVYTPSITHAMKKAIKQKNGVLVKTFCNLMSSSSIPKRRAQLLLGTAIKTSEEMTKLLLEQKIGLRVLSDEPISCTNEPGCEYYKKAFDQALKDITR